MKNYNLIIKRIETIIFMMYFLLTTVTFNLLAANQTATVSKVSPSDSLPFEITIEQADFQLPQGLQSFVSAQWKGKLVLLTGRMNGLHGFTGDGYQNFDPNESNTNIYVIDLKEGTVAYRSFVEDGTWLSQAEIDLLLVTNAQSLQIKRTLYLVGGYGYDNATSDFTTKDTLTAFDVPELIRFVENNEPFTMRTISNPILQVTGGYMGQADEKNAPVLLIVGQNFEGGYTPGSNGIYTKQIRAFHLRDDGENLKIEPTEISSNPLSAYRRRDLNVVPVIYNKKRSSLLQSGFLVLAGVFTETDGAWTVPIRINPYGWSLMADPDDDNTFKQAMNHYHCAHVGLFNAHTGNMYTILFGGISYGYFKNGVYTTDAGMPFINQVTTVKMDKDHKITQYLMNGEYPKIASTGSNPGNLLLFGAEAEFVPRLRIRKHKNGIVRFERIGSQPVVLGYIIGGIMSTLPNTTSRTDSAASPYIFKVTIEPK